MKVFLLAGEVSGDRLGGALMAGLKELRDDMEFHGIGGEQMQSHGLTSLFPMEELSIMGLAEVLPKYFHLKRRIRETADEILRLKPDAVITIDAPDFSLRVAKLVKEASNIRTVHYVAPSVWAWRPKRAAKMAKVIDHVLALLPFEPPYMTAHGMECDFVGHPVTTEVQATDAEAADFRARFGIGDAPLILALPGSRRGEVSRLADRFGAALAQVVADKPNSKIVLPCAAPVAQLVRDLTANWAVQPILLDPSEMTAADKRAAFKAADIALAASGTVSLELAAARTPMVIAYDFNKITWAIMRRMALIDTFTLVNLVSETRAVPEFLGPECRPELIAPAILSVLNDPTAQRSAMDVTMQRLGEGGEAPGLRAARAVLARL
ncbi:lipid-A-disaccharide synthase [Marivivens sp.]|jgi:lipid-A-disaccharide synthase|uniref:lipid-A-disaccharide synthase n=1 Tax=Marivivens sp. TaxID=1978374 RepID=UPI00201EA61E|nr:lipid-A-disaccharide synthase [Marivivens sp.]MCL7405874.1 lipid-A-disaccharide synthase [Marivivens geojensis]